MQSVPTPSRDPDLPDYDRPPVGETALSVQFDKLTKMKSMHLGLFGRKMQDLFPTTEERLPIPPAIEQFSEIQPHDVHIRFEAVETFALPRLLLLSSTGTEMIQIQNDRFTTNWWKTKEQDKYPHYDPRIKPAFERDFQKFQAFLAEEQLGPLKVNQCEVTYVNHIIGGSGWEKLGEFGEIFAFWNELPDPLSHPEDLVFHIRFPIRDENNRLIGRLHVNAQPALRTTDRALMYVVNLTARGQLGTGFEFFDVGRKWIVKAFDALTTQNMHAVWEKK